MSFALMREWVLRLSQRRVEELHRVDLHERHVRTLGLARRGWMAMGAWHLSSWGRAEHLAAALVCCVILPGYSKIRGEGGLAWTMFSRSDTFRLTVHAIDREGAVHTLHPAALAGHAEPFLRYFLIGADRYRTWPVGPTFRGRLPELAALGCEVGRYASVDVVLEERANLDARPRATHARVPCP